MGLERKFCHYFSLKFQACAVPGLNIHLLTSFSIKVTWARHFKTSCSEKSLNDAIPTNETSEIVNHKMS